MRPCTLLAALFLGAHGVPHGEHASSADGVVPRSPRELEPEDVDDIMQHQAQKEIEDEIKRKEQDLADKATKIAVIKAGLDSLAINEGIDCTTANQETMEGAMTCKFKEYYFKKSTASEIKYFTHNIVALALFIKMRGGMHRPRTGSIYASFDERPVDDPLHKKALLLENPASGEFVRVPIDLKEYFGMDKLPLMEIDKLRLFFSAGAEQMNVQSTSRRQRSCPPPPPRRR
ncbi:hypothetical protein DCS_03354 [Drechmeria coniospora]|uniref:Uncharacterized protein n=1 Tax=Drechmeria coniospora TaxID=98403 RepID=A0A151GGZ5_DRECN|nr:hypothetical protein DCS_03354 [Drechmeria coniospora]KYK56354.1 hypothetical protein DCS_03354 [Drechmeria coniospora]